MPPEPAALADRVRAHVLADPASWPRVAGDGTWVAAELWPRWAAELGRRGVTPEALAEAAAGYRQELWLWLMGERPWPHVAAALGGRALRRAPGGAAPI